MLRFFRLIRRKLIEDDQMRKYIWYALGEISLVVVGILIAVQVNVGLENKRNEVIRKELVNGLKIEFQENLAQLDTVISYHKGVYESGIELVNLMAKKDVTLDDEKIYKLIARNGNVYTFDPINGVLNSSISAGEIHLLKSDELKAKLFSWEGLVSDAYEEQVRAGKHYAERVWPYLDEHISIARTNVVYKDKIPESSFLSSISVIMNDRLFENHLVGRSILTIDVLLELETLHKINREILSILKEDE